MSDLIERLRNPDQPTVPYTSLAELCSEAAAKLAAAHDVVRGQRAEIERLRAALQDAVDNCCECGGTGNTYTVEDETLIGQAPGTSRVDCPCCWKQRVALSHQQSTGEKP